MPQFAANLSLMYTEHDFLKRFGAAARAYWLSQHDAVLTAVR